MPFIATRSSFRRRFSAFRRPLPNRLPALSCEDFELLISQLWLLVNIRLTPRIHYGARLRVSEMSEADCLRKFRFTYEQIIDMTLLLDIPESLLAKTCRVEGHVALCMLLYRLSGCRSYHDIGTFFKCDKSFSCTIITHLVALLMDRWRLIIDFNSHRMAASVNRYAAAIRNAGAPLQNCIGLCSSFSFIIYDHLDS